MWELFNAHPWLLPTCVGLILLATMWLVRFLVKNAGPDDDVTVWALPIRIAIRRGTATRPRAPAREAGSEGMFPVKRRGLPYAPSGSGVDLVERGMARVDGQLDPQDPCPPTPRGVHHHRV